jgi:hypothetical protein
MRTSYSFSVLRYVHDPVTQEFINIGVAVFSANARFFRANCTTHYARITRMFTKIDGNRFRQLTRYIQDHINEIGQNLSLKPDLPFDSAPKIEHLLAQVLPVDDSSVQFSHAGAGLSSDLEKTLAELFDRYVERYALSGDWSRRDDEDIWRTFREPMERRHITAYLSAKRIVAPNYDYEFQHAWKNQVWHLYEPVSFDMVDGGSIVEKANRWLGRATSLNDSSENFKIHLLLGEPQEDRLRGSYVKAQNILNKMPGKKEFIQESEAEDFADELEKEVRRHEKPD